MEDQFKNKLGFILFITLVIALLVGGYFLTEYLTKKEEKPKNNVDISYKIDEDKDYIYYEDDEIISEEAEINYKNVVINLKEQTTLTEQLKNENEIYKNNIKHISEMDILSSEIIKYNNDDIYALSFRSYDDYKYKNYMSLLVRDYNYSCFDAITFNKVKAYTFNTKTGKLVTEEELLKKYDITMDLIKEKIRSYLEDNQEEVDGQNLIDIDLTLQEFNNYGLYINNYGHLQISFLVKSSQEDYNEIMEVK